MAPTQQAKANLLEENIRAILIAWGLIEKG